MMSGDFQLKSSSMSGVLAAICQQEVFLKVAQFVPTVGYLLCPHCHQVVTASDGKMHLLHADMAERWEVNQRLPWQCNSC